MSLALLVCTICAILSSSWLESVDAQFRSESDSGSIIQSIETLSKVVENLQTEIKMQSSVLETSLKNLEAKAAMHDNSLSNLQATVDELKTLLINSKVKEDEQVASLSNLEVQPNMPTTLLNEVGANVENQTHVLNNLLTKDQIANNFTGIGGNVTTVCDSVETFTDNQSSSATQGVVEGIIASTKGGVVIIQLNTRNQRTITSTDMAPVYGVAFNWHSRKVYWMELEVGIKTADLDGSHAEVIVSDSAVLFGLAVDQITGNLYYGEKGSDPSIRVCDSMGKKCVTIASGLDNVGCCITDIALFPSEGLMFWSGRPSPFDKKGVIRANMDGTNATVIMLGQIDGLYLDEFKQKFYWANSEGKSIGQSDLNGCNPDFKLNTTIHPNDIAVDGDTLYFGGAYPDNGVYSVTSNGNVSSNSNTYEEVYHIALYGRNKVSSRPNPCKNFPCANLCVLTRASYTCL